ncbi:hypothetical protein [Variovorax sp. PAMC26660]|uniref:hypothetical protein n=1 Tax=Variovorax sp. PAMC26660 TaxID=2762322 RepID=UPI00164D44D3|nr:hypothetical protein [Variovorax sp. PAMC26660]QNK66500.1 hypothetical protein H7F35_25395 [Variovorax sp. PAMC26660]
MIVNLTTVNPLVTPGATPPWRATSPVALADAAASQVTPASAVSVSLGQTAASADVQTYLMPSRAIATTAWQQRPDDAISSLMAGNIVYSSLSTRLKPQG